MTTQSIGYKAHRWQLFLTTCSVWRNIRHQFALQHIRTVWTVHQFSHTTNTLIRLSFRAISWDAFQIIYQEVAHTHTHTYTHTHAHTHTYTHMYTHTHAHTRTQTHTHTHRLSINTKVHNNLTMSIPTFNNNAARISRVSYKCGSKLSSGRLSRRFVRSVCYCTRMESLHWGA